MDGLFLSRIIIRPGQGKIRLIFSASLRNALHNDKKVLLLARKKLVSVFYYILIYFIRDIIGIF